MLSFDPKQAVTHLQSVDPILSSIIDHVGSFQLQLGAKGFAALVDAIVSQQISTKAATTILNRLVDSVGELTPTAFYSQTPETLRSIGLSRQKSTYILDLAVKVDQGIVDFDNLDQLDDEQIIAQLTQVKGIGRWTTEMYLIFALGRPNILPIDDLGLKQALKKAYSLDELPQKTTFRRIAIPWHPYCSVASWYLWRSLDDR